MRLSAARRRSADKLSVNAAGGISEISSSESEIGFAGGFAGNRNCAVREDRDQPTEIEIVEVRIDPRRAILSQRYRGVAARAAIECFSDEVVDLNLVAARND